MENAFESNNNKTANYLAIILAVLLIGLGIFSYKTYLTQKENQAAILNEKLEIQADLDEKIQALDEAISENNGLKDRLSSFKDSLISFKSEVRKLKDINYATIRKYKKKLQALEIINNRLMKDVDSLRQANYALSMTVDSTKAVVQAQQKVIGEQQKIADSLHITTREMSKTIEKGAALKISEVNVTALKRRSSGKLVETSRSRRTDVFRIEFVIRENSIAKAGNRTAYIVVKDEHSNVIAPTGNFNDAQGHAVSYTDSTVIKYENADKDVIILTEMPENTLERGTYIIEIYLEGKLQDTGEIYLK